MKIGDQYRVTEKGYCNDTDMEEFCDVGDVITVESQSKVHCHFNCVNERTGENLLLFYDDVDNGFVEEL